MEVIVNGILIDTDGAVIAINKQGYDFGDLKTRFLGRTNSFSLPKTSKNRDVFKAPDIINSSANSFEVFYNVTVEDQGVVVLKGTGQLTDAGKSYKFQVIDSAKALFDAMSANLDQLDLSGSDFIFSLSAYVNLNEYTGNGTVWIWAADTQHINKSSTKTVINWLSDGSAWAPIIKWSRPHFNAGAIISEALAANGWTMTGGALNLAAITSNHETFYVTSYQITLNQVITSPDYPTLEIVSGLDSNDFQQAEVVVASTKITIPTRPTKFRIKGNITATSDFQLVTRFLSKPLDTDEITDIFNIRNGDTYIDFLTSELNSEESTGDFILAAGGTGTLDLTGVELYSVIEENAFGDLSGGDPQAGVLDGFLVKVVENVPDITQLDLFRELWTVFPFGFNINQATKTLEQYTYELPRGNAVDWSEKYMLDSETVNLPNPDLGQVSTLEYSNDETITSGEAGSFFNVENEVLQSRVIYLQSGFSASKELLIQIKITDGLGDHYFNIPLTSMDIYDDQERVNTLGLRVKRIRVGDGGSFEEFGWQTSAVFTGLSWTDLKNDSYLTIIEALQKGRKIKASFNLNKLDVVGVDFSRSVYLDQLKSYFILSLINNYIPGRLTKCELLKIN